MAYKIKGAAKNGGGRPPGSKNIKHNTHKATPIEQPIFTESAEAIGETDDIREAIRGALIKNIPNVGKWLEDIAADDPKGALTMFRDFAEFVLPKLMRTDSKIDPSSPINIVFENIENHKRRMEEKKQLLTTKATPDDFAKSN